MTPNIKLHTDCTNVWENKQWQMVFFVFCFFLRQWSSVDIKWSSYQKKKKKNSYHAFLKHITAPTKTNVPINIIDISLRKGNSSKTQPALMNDQFLSCHICDHVTRYYILDYFYHNYWDESGENDF